MAIDIASPGANATALRTALRASLGDGVINVKDYGAVGNGVADDTAAIQAAIDYVGLQGGGIVYLPPGEFIIRPPAIGTGHALVIDYDNVLLRGVKDLTKLTFQLYNGSSPATNWPIVSGAVIRGHGIRVNGTNSATAPRKNFHLSGIELNGGAGKTNNRTFPANTTTGDGWDLTHKGIYIEENKNHDNIVIEDCYIHAWRGECIHYGGVGLKRLTVQKCIIADTNSDGLSATVSALIFNDNVVYDCYNAAVENAYQAGLNQYIGNIIYDCANGGIQSIPASSAISLGYVDIARNRISRCNTTGGIVIPGAVNTRVFDNTLIDCLYGISCGSISTGGSGVDLIRSDNVEIYGNRIIADTVGGVDTGIYIAGDATNSHRRLHVHDNVTLKTQNAISNSISLRRGINQAEVLPEYFGSGCRIERNYCFNGSQEDYADAIARDVLLSTTSQTTIAQVFRRDRTNHALRVSWRVINASTDLTLNVAWRAADGVLQSKNLTTGAQAVGAYSAEWSMMTGGNSGYVGLAATAGTANNVYVAADITN